MKTEISNTKTSYDSNIIPREIKNAFERKIESRLSATEKLFQSLGRKPTKKEWVKFMESEKVQHSETLSELAQKVIERLSEKERRILDMRFGTRNNSEHTMEEVASRFGISKQYVKVIEDKALGIMGILLCLKQ